jgi:hypothetical protein
MQRLIRTAGPFGRSNLQGAEMTHQAARPQTGGRGQPGLLLPEGYAQTPSHTPPAGMTCPGDKVVWVNTRSGVCHFQGERYFGGTKRGKLICGPDADEAIGQHSGQ